MTTKAIEDYLKAIYQVEVDHGEVTTTLLAERLRVSPASVTGMLKKLSGLKLVSYTRYQGVKLTPDGRAIALRMVRYHRLAERYLADVLGLSWDEVHVEAEEWEHVLSERVAGRLDAAMGRPSTDPHGEPIPTREGAIVDRQEVALAALHEHDRATVSRVESHDPELLRYLGDLGLYPGVPLQVLAVAPFEGPLTVEIDGRPRPVGQTVAESVFVVK